MDLSHSVLPAALLLLAGAGHAFLWIGLANRVDAMGALRPVIKTATGLCFLCMAALFAAWLAWAVEQRENFRTAWDGIPQSRAVHTYLAGCCIVAVVTLIRSLCLQFRRPPSVVRSCRRRRLPIRTKLPTDGTNTPALASRDHHLFTRLPGNETLQLELSEWSLDIPGLDAALDGLSLLHLSDLHCSGRIGKSYFHEVVGRCNELQPDIVAITGDLADRASCLDWPGEVLGRLAARYGVYFVLGNHDFCLDADRLRQSMTERGLIHLGGRWMQIDVRGRPVILVGNERPWSGPAVSLNGSPPRTAKGSPLRIALTHTPDQLRWARAHGIDLLLAGHTHGGQIRIPPLGAIRSPSFSGVKHVSGVFYRPPTILHVTRGVSGSVPFRWNCPPELALLRLRAGRPSVPSPSGRGLG